MKSNFIIGGCVFTLIGLAIVLVALTLAPMASTVASSQSTSYNWYFKPREDGKQPTVADNVDFLDKYDALYMGKPESKNIYLTFDAGYENGNTEKILNVLKEKNVTAAFFLCGHYFDSNPELIKRMVDEGHLVCNHTVNHKNLAASTSPELYEKEIEGLEEKFYDITGQDMPKFIRPPEGKYSEYFLEKTKDMGYTTVFWSFAYMDWENYNQPSPASAKEKILKRTHPGEVALLHSTSATNAEVLGDVIDSWREQGYTLKSLNDLKKEVASGPTSVDLTLPPSKEEEK